jgi:hypothetical protein
MLCFPFFGVFEGFGGLERTEISVRLHVPGPCLTIRGHVDPRGNNTRGNLLDAVQQGFPTGVAVIVVR